MSSYLYGQKKNVFEMTDRGELIAPWFIPHEIMYGGLIRESKYYSQFYTSYNLIGQLLPSKYDTQKHLSLGISYSRMFSTDNVSIFPYYGRVSWVGTHSGVKLEPIFNIQKTKFEYTNLEFTFGWYLSLALSAGIPYNFKNNSPYYGFKIGWSFPYPIFQRNQKE